MPRSTGTSFPRGRQAAPPSGHGGGGPPSTPASRAAVSAAVAGGSAAQINAAAAAGARGGGAAAQARAAAAARAQQQAVRQYVAKEAKKKSALNQEPPKLLDHKGKAVTMQPRQVGEDPHAAAQRLAKADITNIGLTDHQQKAITNLNSHGKVVAPKAIKQIVTYNKSKQQTNAYFTSQQREAQRYFSAKGKLEEFQKQAGPTGGIGGLGEKVGGFLKGVADTKIPGVGLITPPEARVGGTSKALYKAPTIGEAAIALAPVPGLKVGKVAQNLAHAVTKTPEGRAILSDVVATTAKALAPKTATRAGAILKTVEKTPLLGARFETAPLRSTARTAFAASVPIGGATHPEHSAHQIASAVTALGDIHPSDIKRRGAEAVGVVTHLPAAVQYTARALQDPTVFKETLNGIRELGLTSVEFPILAPIEIAHQGVGPAANELLGGYVQDVKRRWGPIISGPALGDNQNYNEFLKQVKKPGAGGVAYQITELLPIIHGVDVGAKHAVGVVARGGELAHIPGAKEIRDFLSRERPALQRSAGRGSLREQPLSKGLLGLTQQRLRDYLGVRAHEHRVLRHEKYPEQVELPYPRLEHKGQLARPPIRGPKAHVTKQLRYRMAAKRVAEAQVNEAITNKNVADKMQEIERTWVRHPAFRAALALEMGAPLDAPWLIDHLQRRLATIPKTSQEWAVVHDAVLELRANPKLVSQKFRTNIEEMGLLQDAVTASTPLLGDVSARTHALTAEQLSGHPESSIGSLHEELGPTDWAIAEERKAAASHELEQARKERDAALPSAEAARRATLRKQIPEAEAKGRAELRGKQLDREVLKVQPEYVDAAKKLNKASAYLTEARKQFGNVARYPGRGRKGKVAETAELRMARRKVKDAELGLRNARKRMDVVKSDLAKKAEAAASKKARGEKLTTNEQRLVRLARAPAGSLRSLERKGGKVLEAQVAEPKARERARLAKARYRQARKAWRDAQREVTRAKSGRTSMERNWFEDSYQMVNHLSPEFIAAESERLGMGRPSYYPARFKEAGKLAVPGQARSRTMIPLGERGVLQSHGALARRGGRRISPYMSSENARRVAATEYRRVVVTRTRDEGGISLDDMRKGKNTTLSHIPEDKLTARQKLSEMEEAGFDPNEWAAMSPTWEKRVSQRMEDPKMDLSEKTYLEVMTDALGDTTTRAAQMADKPEFDKPGVRYVPQDELRIVQDQANMGPRQLHDNYWSRLKTFASKALLASPGWLAWQLYAPVFLAGLGQPSVFSPKLWDEAHQWYKGLSNEERAAVEGVIGVSPRSIEGGYEARRIFQGSLVLNDLRERATVEKFTKGRSASEWFFSRVPAWERMIRRPWVYKGIRKEAWKKMDGFSARVGEHFHELGTLFSGRETRAEFELKMNEVITDQRLMEKVGRSVTEWLGDYETFNPLEKTLSQGIFFYGFLRHSMSLALWTLPVKHPVRLQILAAAGKMASTQQKTQIVEVKRDQFVDFMGTNLGMAEDKATHLSHLFYPTTRDELKAGRAWVIKHLMRQKGLTRKEAEGIAKDAVNLQTTIPPELMGRFMLPNGEIMDAARASPLGNQLFTADTPLQALGIFPGANIALGAAAGIDPFSGSKLAFTATGGDGFFPRVGAGIASAAGYISPLRLFSQAESKYPASQRTASSFPLGPLSGLPGLNLFREQAQKYTSPGNSLAQYQYQMLRRQMQVEGRGGWKTVEQAVFPFLPHPQAYTMTDMLYTLASTSGKGQLDTLSARVRALQGKHGHEQAIKAAQWKIKHPTGSVVLPSDQPGGKPTVLLPSDRGKKGPVITLPSDQADAARAAYQKLLKPSASDTGGRGYFNTIKTNVETIFGSSFFGSPKGGPKAKTTTRAGATSGPIADAMGFLNNMVGYHDGHANAKLAQQRQQQPPGPKPTSQKHISPMTKKLLHSAKSLGPDGKQMAAAAIKFGNQTGVNPSVLMAIGNVESGFGTDITGPPNYTGEIAQGWMQFLPSTAAGIKKKYGVDALADPTQAVHAAALKLRDDGFANDQGGALLAYNNSASYVAGVLAAAQSTFANYDKATPRGVQTQLGLGTAPKKSVSRYRAIVKAANSLDKLGLPYSHAGHETTIVGNPKKLGGLDCSSTVSWLLQRAGYDVPASVSGQMTSWGKPGPGAVTIFANADHVFLRIGGKYFGTSGSNPSGGPGWIPTSYEQGEAQSGKYVVRHMPGLGQKVALQMGLGGGATTFPGVNFDAGGTTATVPQSGAVVQNSPGFSDKPIRATLSGATPLQALSQLRRGGGVGIALPGIGGRGGAGAALGGSLPGMGGAAGQPTAQTGALSPEVLSAIGTARKRLLAP